jgi:hypothetical protein
LSSVAGQPTMANASGNNEQIATHALVFMLAGVSSQWKQTVAYVMTLLGTPFWHQKYSKEQ